jgi:hypothetical protein
MINIYELLLNDSMEVSLILAYIGIGVSSLAFIICLIIIAARYPHNWENPTIGAIISILILITCASVVKHINS